MMLNAKSWVRRFGGEMAIHAGELPNGLVEVRVGSRYIAMTQTEWAALPRYCL